MSSTSALSNTSAGPMTAMRAIAGVALLASALWLGWKAWDVNITMSCWKNEWPHLQACEDILGKTSEEKVAKLQQRLASNPGDSEALVLLAIWANQPGGMPGLDAAALLKAAGKAAPQNKYVLSLQSREAVKQRQWPEAIDSLKRLSQFHRDNSAAQTLASLVAFSAIDPSLATALAAASKTDGEWLDRVLRNMPKAQIEIANALPLITQLMESRQLTPALGQFVIGRLKSEGLWMEAHAVWRHLWNRPLDTVFNGDFEQAFVRGGFDWEVADANDHRSGAQIDLVGRNGKGQVLKVEFTGKAIRPPVLRQDLLLLPGAYKLKGSMQSTDLRSEKGLAWVVACASDGRELGRTAPLKATGRDWSNWEAQITMPDDCSAYGARLTLQTFAPYESKTGLRGDVFFDGLRLEKAKENP